MQLLVLLSWQRSHSKECMAYHVIPEQPDTNVAPKSWVTGSAMHYPRASCLQVLTIPSCLLTDLLCGLASCLTLALSTW